MEHADRYMDKAIELLRVYRSKLLLAVIARIGGLWFIRLRVKALLPSRKMSVGLRICTINKIEIRAKP